MFSNIRTKLITICMLAIIFWGGPNIYNAWAAPELEVDVERTVGNKQNDRGYYAQPTNDGGYIIAGESQSYHMHGNGDYDAYLIKLDTKGHLEWKHTFGNAKNDRGYSVQQTGDGGYIMAGTTQPVLKPEGNNVYLVKTDTSGREEWHKEFGGTGEDTGACVLQTADGGYIIAGATSSSGAGDSDVYLIKTNAEGKKEWEKTLGGKETDFATAVRQTSDGGYIVTGQTYSFGAGGYDVYLIKTDAHGNQIWAQTFGGAGWDTAASVEQTKDGDYIVAGQTASFGAGNSDIYLIKINYAGKKIWEKTFGGADLETGKTVQQTSDGGFLVAGWSNSVVNRELCLYLVKTDANGKKLWEKTWHNGNLNREFSIMPNQDKGYIVTGWRDEQLGITQKRNDGIDVYMVGIGIE
ncbi:hypothetical protein SPSYN_00288 [Sporotomaculum syntrophicum]|uniref:Beta-propeller repeat protein n=1 Tax=Sporotomaculum syntrophicum TaxID=182264 RepID=A0A9D2WSI1_9FIRM|nr:hypothetical protein [Sporotomaculum syntrophicum]KAF1086569.1 hypothetical protein SPSYN_00288 [Sporotomaculum syntrophicum]